MLLINTRKKSAELAKLHRIGCRNVDYTVDFDFHNT